MIFEVPRNPVSIAAVLEELGCYDFLMEKHGLDRGSNLLISMVEAIIDLVEYRQHDPTFTFGSKDDFLARVRVNMIEHTADEFTPLIVTGKQAHVSP